MIFMSNHRANNVDDDYIQLFRHDTSLWEEGGLKGRVIYNSSKNVKAAYLPNFISIIINEFFLTRYSINITRSEGDLRFILLL